MAESKGWAGQRLCWLGSLAPLARAASCTLCPLSPAVCTRRWHSPVRVSSQDTCHGGLRAHLLQDDVILIYILISSAVILFPSE